MGQMEVTWTLHGDSDETVDLNELLNEYEEEEFDTSDIQDDIRSQVETHVTASGYRNPSMSPKLDFVDVEFDGEGSAVPTLKTAFAGPEGRMELTATFKLDTTSGGKRRNRRMKKSRSTRRRV